MRWLKYLMIAAFVSCIIIVFYGIIFEINNSYIQRYIQELKNPNEEIRNNAIISLVKMGENAMPYLLSQLNDPNVVKVLEKMDDETIVKSFVHPDWKVRMRATRLPKHIGQGAIIRSLNSPNRKVRQNAAHVLIYNICNNDDEYLLKNAKEFTAIFIQALNDPNENVRCAVAKALRYLGPEAKEAIPTLIQSLKDSNTNVRIVSTETLGKIGNDNKEVMEALKKNLNDIDLYVRIAAAYALSEVTQDLKEITPFLMPLMKDENPDVRTTTLEILGKIK